MPDHKKKKVTGISVAIESILVEYFLCHEGQMPTPGLYSVVMNQVEKPLIKTTLNYVNGNQCRAAELLGINRNTLRKKMIDLGLTV